MDFHYDKSKEAWTKEEVAELLTQHSTAVSKGKVSKEDYDKVLADLKPFQLKETKSKLTKALSGIVADNRLEDAIKLSNISDEMTIEEKVAEIKKTVEDRDYLKAEAAGQKQIDKVLTVNDFKEKTAIKDPVKITSPKIDVSGL